MKIHLVTGATGFVGKYLVNALLEKGENVWIIVRPLNNVSAQARAKEIFHDYASKGPGIFRVIDGDIMIENLGLADFVVDELKNHEVIFWHLAANLSFASENRAEAQKTNYTGTVNVVNFANKVAKKFVHMSTAYVCGNSRSFGENELDKGQKFRNHYEESKFKAEKYVRNNCKLPCIIFRPSVIIGDAYRGKAEGCTFGYYRYMFMFHFFKKQVVKTLQKNGFISFCLRSLGMSYDVKNDTLTMPALVIPYPRNRHVDLVTVDYVVESMIRLYEKNLSNITVHLTHHNPPKFNFMLQAVLSDLGYQRMKLIPVPAWIFKTFIKSIYFFVIPIRKYTKSVMWYVPYFTDPCHFERSTAENHLENPPEISRELVSRINKYAKENILDHIEI
jgi:nucleoside-diphosphate-sugar epimerase